MTVTDGNHNQNNGNNGLDQKLARLRAGASPRVLDLFAGCGGMSLGFQRAGYEIVAAIEIDAKAIKSHALNFAGDKSGPRFMLHSQPRDITTLSAADFTREVLQADAPYNLVDIIVAGPPCQAFARIGRAKLRKLMNDPQAHLQDERANLYTHFLEYVEHFRPLAVVMENVPEIISFGGKNVAEEIACSLVDLGYRCRYTILNSVFYGIPQMRQRMLLIALLDALDVEPGFPAPTHFINLPEGYHEARRALARNLSFDLFGARLEGLHFVDAPLASDTLLPAVSAIEALGDLPPIYSRSIKKGVRKFDSLARYRDGITLSEYARQMREWPSFASEEGVWDHVTRYLPRDYAIFRRMKPGDEYPAAHAIGVDRFNRALVRYEGLTGKSLAKNSREYKGMVARYIPPYDTGKFPNKWRKMEANLPARTLTAHLGKDTYTHIHYDDDQARVITVREAARLQSFPDGFRFEGPMNPAFKQIGNAVPPLLAFAIAAHLQQLLLQAVRDPARELEISLQV